jgi:hypothetical protein
MAVLGTILTASSFIGDTVLFRTSNIRAYVSGAVSIVAPCVISEKSDDNYVITEHPTEMGVLISDHMYALPKTVDITIAYSISGGYNALKAAGALIGASSSPLSLEQYYANFLQLQSDRIPFEITTGKRRYRDMLIENISNTTDTNTENMLMINMRAKQILIVNTKTTPDKAYQKDSANTAAPDSRGTLQLKAL